MPGIVELLADNDVCQTAYIGEPSPDRVRVDGRFNLQAVEAAIRADQRERCARLADRAAQQHCTKDSHESRACADLAAAIRRGDEP